MSNRPLRRAKGTGSIRQRSKGGWEIRYDGPPDTNGRRRKVSEAVRGSRRDAEKVLRERLGAVDTNTYLEKSSDTVATFMMRWLRTDVATNTSPSTQRGYEANVRRYIDPTLGQIPLQELRAQSIQAMYADMQERGLGPQTVVHAHRVLREALARAVKWGELTTQPG